VFLIGGLSATGDLYSPPEFSEVSTPPLPGYKKDKLICGCTCILRFIQGLAIWPIIGNLHQSIEYEHAKGKRSSRSVWGMHLCVWGREFLFFLWTVPKSNPSLSHHVQKIKVLSFKRYDIRQDKWEIIESPQVIQERHAVVIHSVPDAIFLLGRQGKVFHPSDNSWSDISSIFAKWPRMDDIKVALALSFPFHITFE